MKKTIIILAIVALLGLGTIVLFEPEEHPSQNSELNLSQIDRTDPDAVASIFSLAYITRDLDAIASFMPPRFREDFKDLTANRESGDIYNLLFNTPDKGWQHVSNIQANLPPARIEGEERLYPLARSGDEIFVLTLAAESDGTWYVEGVHSPDLQQFNSLPLADL